MTPSSTTVAEQRLTATQESYIAQHHQQRASAAIAQHLGITAERVDIIAQRLAWRQTMAACWSKKRVR